MLEELKKEICGLNAALKNNGLVAMTSGNVSGRDRKQPDYIVIKPSGVSYEALKPKDMVVVDMRGRVKEGSYKPSVDTISHLVVYRARKDIFGIVHTHSNFATSFALLGKPLPVYMTAHADEFGAAIPVTRYASPLPFEDVGNAIIETLGKKNLPGVLLRNHGVFTFGENPKSALKAAVMIEDIAKTCWLAMQNGKIKRLPEKEIKKWYYRYHEIYGQKK